MGQGCGSKAILPGGYEEGNLVYYSAANQHFPAGELRYGTLGNVTGPSQVQDGKDDERVAVKFPNFRQPVACFVAALQTKAPPAILPGGWRIGESLVYLGETRESEDGHRLAAGMSCVVAGPTGPTDGGASIAVLFPGHSVAIVVASEELARLGEVRACPAVCAMEICETIRARPEKVGSTIGVWRLGSGSYGELTLPMSSKGHAGIWGLYL